MGDLDNLLEMNSSNFVFKIDENFCDLSATDKKLVWWFTHHIACLLFLPLTSTSFLYSYTHTHTFIEPQMSDFVKE